MSWIKRLFRRRPKIDKATFYSDSFLRTVSREVQFPEAKFIDAADLKKVGKRGV